MSKKIVKFIAAFQSYTRNDVAGFDVETANDLVNVKKVAVAYEPEGATDQPDAPGADEGKAKEEIARAVAAAQAEALAEAKKRTEELDDREAKLKEREDAVVAAEQVNTDRSKELDAREAALPAPASAGKGEDKAKKPPVQGGK